LEPLVTGQVEPLGPLMKGLLETPGLTVTGQLGHGQVNEAPSLVSLIAKTKRIAERSDTNCDTHTHTHRQTKYLR
jgi:hypothetical protein